MAAALPIPEFAPVTIGLLLNKVHLVHLIKICTENIVK
jgi:hypothetical protein